MAVPTSEGVETQVEGASGGSPEGNIDELVMVWESIHLGPFQMEIIEGWVKPLLRDTSYVMITPLRGLTMGNETTSPWTPCPSCLHMPQEWQWEGVASGQKCVGQPHLPQEGCVFGTGCVHITGATHRVVARDGSHTRCGILTRTHVGGSETRKVVGEIELGWVGSLVP